MGELRRLPKAHAEHPHYQDLEQVFDQLNRRMHECFDRRHWQNRGTKESAALRRACRIDVLKAAQLCVELYTTITGKERLPSKHKMPRPTRKAPTPSRSPSVILNVLAHAMVEIHHELLLTDARISGKTEPTEGLIYLRGTGSNTQEQTAASIDEGQPRSRVWPLVKPWADKLAATLLLILLALPLAIIAIAVKLDSSGPALSRQQRVGRGGKPFIMYKFRTMRTDSEELKRELTQLSQNSDGLLFKIRVDPRITRAGSFLRRSSLDELPSLLNVLRGEMSLVGPRPHLLDEVSEWDSALLRRLTVKPGLTGLYQISGRSDLPWEEAVRLDLEYVDHYSARLDLVILARTFWAVISGTGAY